MSRLRDYSTSEWPKPDGLWHPLRFAWLVEPSHVGQVPAVVAVLADAARDSGRADDDAGGQSPSPLGRGVRGEVGPDVERV